MRENKHGKQINESVKDETELPGSVDEVNNLEGGQPGNRGQRGKKIEEEQDWDYEGRDDDDFEEADEESPDEYDDDYLEDGYEDDRNKDYPEDDDLEYLKQFEETDDHPDDEYGDEKAYKSPFLRIVALVTVLAFLGLALAASWPVLQFPLAELVGRSIQLQKDIDVQRLQAAVVQIDVVSRRQGASIAGERKSGTGFNIRPEGYIITNHHVIDGALNMTITFPGGEIYKAQSWASKPEYDLAVIKLQGASLPVVPVNASSVPAAGDKIRVVGNPLGLNNVVVDGEIDGYLHVKDNPDLVFSINAPVYPGNSGSPVFNQNSEVVGVVFARYYREIEGKEKIFGLAIPIEAVIDIQTRVQTLTKYNN